MANASARKHPHYEQQAATRLRRAGARLQQFHHVRSRGAAGDPREHGASGSVAQHQAVPRPQAQNTQHLASHALGQRDGTAIEIQPRYDEMRR